MVLTTDFKISKFVMINEINPLRKTDLPRFVLEFSVSTVSSSGVLFFARSANGKEILLKFNDEKVR